MNKQEVKELLMNHLDNSLDSVEELCLESFIESGGTSQDYYGLVNDVLLELLGSHPTPTPF